MNSFSFGSRARLYGELLVVAGVAGLSFGCASVPAPNAELASARSQIQDAARAGAAKAAPYEFKSALDHLARAEAAIAAKNNEDARRFTEEAEVDARLATIKTHASNSTLAAREVQKGIRTLKESTNPESNAYPPDDSIQSKPWGTP